MRATETDAGREAVEASLAETISGLDHTYLGPTWMTDADGDWLLPEFTLGWHIAGWCAEYLLADDSTPDEPKPWNFTDEQLRFLLWWYAIDKDGRFVYRKGLLQRLKGWG